MATRRGEHGVGEVRSYLKLLKACANQEDIHKGTKLHSQIAHKGLLENNPYMASALISMYCKCGLLPKAQQLHDSLSIRNLFSWNALISGYAQYPLSGHGALHCFVQMRIEGIPPDPITFTSVLKVCGMRGDSDKGEEIHDEIIDRCLLDTDVLLGNSLVDMYAKCGKLSKAEEVHSKLRYRDVVSWNALITGYVHTGKAHEALTCHRRMQNECLFPDEVTCICLLQACGSIGAINKGKQIHVTRENLDNNATLGNALVDMYAKCGMILNAKKVVDNLALRDTISWSSLILGYVKKGQVHEALLCLEKMQCEGHCLDSVTFICILKACANIGAIEKGKRLHNEMVSRGLLKENIVLTTAVLDMYVKFGLLSKAHQMLLDDIPLRDVVAWNTLIVGYSQQRQDHEAITCFERMRSEGLLPDVVTFTCIFKVCGHMGFIKIGKRCHSEIVKLGLLEKDIMLGNALVDMYAKCGLLTKAQHVLEDLTIRDVVSWTTLIAGYAQRGKAAEALECFEEMLGECIAPNEITFLCVLTACSHSGKLDKAQMYFSDMSEKYRLSPNVQHHTCMLGIYANAGYFEKAMSFVKTMPSLDHSFLVWMTILGACRKWANVKLGRLAFDQLVQLDCKFSLVYVVMADIYAASSIQAHAEMLEPIRTKTVISLVESNGDCKQYQSNHIHRNLKDGTFEMLQNDYLQNSKYTAKDVNIKDEGSMRSEKSASTCASTNTHEKEINQVTSTCLKSSISRIMTPNIMTEDFNCLNIYEVGKSVVRSITCGTLNLTLYDNSRKIHYKMYNRENY